MPESATTTSTIDLLWALIIGTGALFALAVSFIASLYVSQRRYRTAQREKMSALQESESRFRNLVENINDVYYICDANGMIVYGSPNLFTLSGFSEHEILGRSYVRLLAREDRRRVISHYLARIADGTLDTTCEFRARKKDGATVWTEQTTRILRNEQGAITGFRNVVRDISERKHAEHKLAEREGFLRTIIDVTPECILLLNADGSLKSMNPAGLEMVEANSLEEIQGKQFNVFVSAPYRLQFIALTHNVFEGRTSSLEFEIIGLRGTRRWLEIHAVPLYDNHGRTSTLLGITRDMTERRNADEIRQNLTKRIIAAQESERKRISRELHDGIGQMLSSVKFRLHHTLGKRPVSAASRAEASEIDSLLDKTIQEIRRVSQNLRPSVLDDLGLLPAVRAMCDEYTLRTSTSIDLRLPDTPLRFSSEIELALFRIIQETLNNIQKHSGASSVTIAIEQENSKLDVVVRDNGKGFQQELLHNRPIRDRGIGLESIRERAAAIGATVRIASSPGRGTEIVLHVPLRQANDGGVLTQQLQLKESAQS